MENLLQFQNGTKSYGSRNLFREASFSINSDEHVGVIGPNGVGKSTLFRVLIGEETLDSGQIVRAKKLSVGYLSQHDHWQEGQTGNDFLEKATTIPMWELKSQGRILQLSEEILSRPILSLSGGYRMRIKLMGLLGQQPNLMLLDEPTNYLDLETTLVLESFLQGYDGAFLLISHDREFLRRTTDHILEIESGEMTKYNGTIDDYFDQKELLRTQLEARAAHQSEKRKQVLDFVARFGASATKARQAQSRLKSLTRMENIEVKSLPVSSQIRIPAPTKTGKITLSIEQASFGYEDRIILHDVTLQINRGDHVAVVGLNGAGKSTLLKGISGTLTPRKGKFSFGMGVEVAFFAQHVIEALSAKDTVLSSLQAAANPTVASQEILDLAGSLLFSGDDVKKSISVLSGGEKSRVALGRVLLQKASCLVLDEPTNHLDFQTVEALTNALKNYEGTLIVVSHDRGFVKRVGTKILEVANSQVRLYPGTYEEYVWSVQQQELSLEKPKVAEVTKPKAASLNRDLNRDERKRLEKDLRTCEKKLQACEKELQDTQKENELLNQQIVASTTILHKEIRQLSDNASRIEELESAWLVLSEERDSLNAKLRGPG